MLLLQHFEVDVHSNSSKRGHAWSVFAFCTPSAHSHVISSSSKGRIRREDAPPRKKKPIASSTVAVAVDLFYRDPSWFAYGKIRKNMEIWLCRKNTEKCGKYGNLALPENTEKCGKIRKFGFAGKYRKIRKFGFAGNIRKK